MTGRSARERLEEYVAVLRGVGLTESAVAALHGDDAWSGGDLVGALADELGPVGERELHAGLADALATSPRGVDAPQEYWNHAPEVHLVELLSPYGCSVSLEPAKDADTLAEGALAVRLTDAAGRTYWTRFEYPDSDLGTDNYPALVHHVEQHLLGGTGLRIVRLSAPAGRWRFALLTGAQLAALRDRYGERVTVFGEPLLAAEQPEAFDSQVPPIPPGYEPAPDPEPASGGRSLDRGEVESLDELDEPVGADPGSIDLGFDDGDPSPDAIVETVQDSGAGAASTAAVTGGDDVEASDDDLESVFGDLSAVSLEPETPGPEGADEQTAASDAGDAVALDGSAATDDADPLDDLFEEIKRDVAGSKPTTGAEADAGTETTISDLVTGAATDDATGGDASAADRPTDALDDVPQGAADLTASELFDSLDRDR